MKDERVFEQSILLQLVNKRTDLRVHLPMKIEIMRVLIAEKAAYQDDMERA
jgi:hypothetical protein